MKMEVVTFPNKDLTDGELHTETRSIKRNLMALWICAVLANSPTCALFNSSISLLDDESLGILSLAVCGGTQFVVTAVLLRYFTKLWGIRNVITLTFCQPIIYVLLHLYPSWATSLPGGFILGIAQSSITSTFIYGTAVAYYYARLTKGNVQRIILVISACLGTEFGASSLFGNMLLFLIMNEGLANNTNSELNTTYNFCGASYCNEPINQPDNTQPPSPVTYYVIIGVFLTLTITGATLSLFIRDFSDEFDYGHRRESNLLPTVKEMWVLLKDSRGYLLIGMTIFVGAEEGFVLSEYTKAYVTCALGITKVGLIMSAYGATQMICCLLQGCIIQYLGRLIVVLLGCITFTVSFATVLLWQPNPSQVEPFFTVAMLWSATGGLLIPAMFGMYGILFEENIVGSLSLAIFSYSFGYSVAFLWIPYLCVYMKLYIIMIIGCIGLLACLLLEFLLRKDELKKRNTGICNK